jgi:hypothetical protein
MAVLLVVGLTWTLFAVPAALIVGRALRCAGRLEAPAAWTDEVEQFLREQPGARAAG